MRGMCIEWRGVRATFQTLRRVCHEMSPAGRSNPKTNQTRPGLGFIRPVNPYVVSPARILKKLRKQGDTPCTPVFHCDATNPLRHPATASPVAAPQTLPPCLRPMAPLP